MSRIAFNADELKKIEEQTRIAAQAMDEILMTIAAACDRTGLEWEPSDASMTVDSICSEYATDSYKMASMNTLQIAEDYGNLHTWAIPDDLHTNIESTSQGEYVITACGLVLTAPFPTFEEAKIGETLLRRGLCPKNQMN